MDATGPTVRFAGDLDDPWVKEILGSIADHPGLHAVMCGDEMPDRLFEPDQPPRLLILHRSRLSLADAARIEQWRLPARTNTIPRVILCFSPYVRYAELERCSRGVDVAIPEAIAIETLSRHVSRLLGPPDEPRSGARVRHCLPMQVVSTNREFQAILTEICLAEGFEVSINAVPAPEGQGRAAGMDRDSAPILSILDVPVLEPEWPRLIEERSRLGPVIALLGFADRATVRQARTAGAAACLDLPVDSNDLVYVIERVNRKWRSAPRTKTGRRAEPAHTLPPALGSRAKRGREAIRLREPRPPLWSENDPAPTIEETPARRTEHGPANGAEQP